MLCVNVLRTWVARFMRSLLPVTLYHGLFTCCFAYDVCVANKFD